MYDAFSGSLGILKNKKKKRSFAILTWRYASKILETAFQQEIHLTKANPGVLGVDPRYSYPHEQ